MCDLQPVINVRLLICGSRIFRGLCLTSGLIYLCLFAHSYIYAIHGGIFFGATINKLITIINIIFNLNNIIFSARFLYIYMLNILVLVGLFKKQNYLQKTLI